MSTIVANTITIPKRIFWGEYIKALLQNMIIIGYPLPTKKKTRLPFRATESPSIY